MRLTPHVLILAGLLFGTSSMFNGSQSYGAAARVGAVTTELAGLPLEIWYPAAPAAAADSALAPRVYDLRSYLPAAEAKKIPDSAEPFQRCDCTGDLPLASQSAKFPLVIMVHGTAGFRSASLTMATYLAQNGFMVIAADHPNINLKGILGGLFNAIRADQKSDVRKMLKALRAGKAHPYLASADLENITLIGHSAGGGAVADLGREEGVKALVIMAAGSTVKAKPGVFSLILGGVDDQVSSYSKGQSAYASAPEPKAFAGLANAGHLAFTDICGLLPQSGGILETAITYGLKVPDILLRLGRDGCGPDQLASSRGNEVLSEVIRASLQNSAQLETTVASFPELVDYRQAPL